MIFFPFVFFFWPATPLTTRRPPLRPTQFSQARAGAPSNCATMSWWRAKVPKEGKPSKEKKSKGDKSECRFFFVFVVIFVPQSAQRTSRFGVVFERQPVSQWSVCLFLFLVR